MLVAALFGVLFDGEGHMFPDRSADFWIRDALLAKHFLHGNDRNTSNEIGQIIARIKTQARPLPPTTTTTMTIVTATR